MLPSAFHLKSRCVLQFVYWLQSRFAEADVFFHNTNISLIVTALHRTSDFCKTHLDASAVVKHCLGRSPSRYEYSY